MANQNQVLLVSMRVTEEANYQERRSSLAYDYIHFFESLDFTVVPVPCNSTRIAEYLQFDPTAIVLTGGNTVSNDPANSNLPGVYIERDRVENSLIKTAIELEIPMLGICRGMQMINQYFGGRIQHGLQDHVGTVHELVSEISELLNGQSTNSFHTDGMQIQDVAECLNVIATTGEGIVEALVHPDHTMLGVQWHPERQHESFDNTMINRFLRERECPPS